MPGFEIMGDEERYALNQLFDEGAVLFAHGFQHIRKKYHVREFESAIAEKLGSQHALAVSSGTAALKIALKALGIKAGDEVITQAFNFIATVEAILDVGGVPIIANVNHSLNMDSSELASLITTKTKAILPVHMLGVPAQMDEILAIAQQHNLKVLEDNCEALGAKYNNQYLGTIGDAGALSFDFGKVITCGEGGMILTKQTNLDKYAREYHDHGHENNPNLPRGRDTKTIYGFNYRITEMQGVIGKVQLAKLDTIIVENKKRYDALLKTIENLFQMRLIPKGSKPIYDTLIFFVPNPTLRVAILDILTQDGFGTKNLPDALEWHCAAFWNHALSEVQTEHAQKTKQLLAQTIAVPIWLRKSSSDYTQLGEKLRNLIKCHDMKIV